MSAPADGGAPTATKPVVVPPGVVSSVAPAERSRGAPPLAARAMAGVAAALGPLLGRDRMRHALGRAYAVYTLVLYSIQSQHAKALLGSLWTLLAPLILLTIYLPMLSTNRSHDAAALELLGEGRLAFPIYVVVGFLLYSAFSQGLQNGAASLANNREVVHHSPIPLSILPLVKVAESIVGLVLSLSIVVVVTSLANGFPGLRLLLLVPAFGFLFLLTFGLALLLSTIVVFFRDTLQILSALLLVEFFAIPVLYLPGAANGINPLVTLANPLTPLLGLFRAALFPSYPLTALDLGLAAAWSLAAILLGNVLFKRLAPAVAEHA